MIFYSLNKLWDCELGLSAGSTIVRDHVPLPTAWSGEPLDGNHWLCPAYTRRSEVKETVCGLTYATPMTMMPAGCVVINLPDG